MCSNTLRAVVIAVVLGMTTAAVHAAPSAVFENGREAFEAEEWDAAVAALKQEIGANPGHQLAYILLAKSLEQLGKKKDAFDCWSELLDFATDEGVRREARKGFLRTREFDPNVWSDRDPFSVDLDVNYRGLEEIDDPSYEPIRYGGSVVKAPTIYGETKHFTIRTCTHRLTRELGKACENFLAAQTKTLLDDRAWSARIPILCYPDYKAYKSAGMPGGGVTVRSRLTGETWYIAIFQLHEEDDPDAVRLKSRVKHNIEDVLGHELTHLVLNEFFGGVSIPRWINEGTANQYMLNRDDYREIANLARDSVSGEFIRFRELFAAREYPRDPVENFRFYDQGAAIATFLAEHGPEAFRAFLDELRLQHGHDAAAAAALGIPEEGAVEEFERQWNDWMTIRYRRNLSVAEEAEDCVNCEECEECVRCYEDCDADECYRCVTEENKKEDSEDLPCKPRCWFRTNTSKSPVFQPGIALKKTLEKIADSAWTKVPADSMDDFVGVADARRYWELDDGMLRCTLKDDSPTAALLAFQSYEELPLVFRCRAKYVGEESSTLFGFAQLNLDGEELGVQTVTALEYGKTYDVKCLLADDLMLYLNGKCVGRTAAVRTDNWKDETDYPVALVAAAPMQVWDLDVVTLKDREIIFGPDDDEQAGAKDGEGKKKEKKSTKKRRGRGGGSDFGGGGGRL